MLFTFSDAARTDYRYPTLRGAILDHYFSRIVVNASKLSDHMYRMAVLAMCVSDQALDISRYCARFNAVNVPVDVELRCVMMAVVHDLAEAQGAVVTACRNSPLTLPPPPVGDIAPQERAFRRQKSKSANPVRFFSNTVSASARVR